MKIYTKTGDKGKTSLYDGKRISKSSIIFEVIGEIDELTSRIGMLYSLINNDKINSIHQEIKKYFGIDNLLSFFEIDTYLKKIQQILQDINSNIATINKNKKLPKIEEEFIKEIENNIDEMDKQLPKLTKFILPGEKEVDAQCHLCRTQTRKVERFLWKLDKSAHQEILENNQTLDLNNVKIDQNILKFINRLSDYFFTLGRILLD